MNQALSKAERIEALNLALSTFSHKNTKLHDYEIQLGADKALCLKLGYVFMTFSSSLEEIRLIGECLKQIYQCSQEQRKRSFRVIGGTELAPLLIEILMKGLNPNDQNKLDSEVMIVLVGVLRVFAKLECAKRYLVRLGKGYWLGETIRYCVKNCTRGTNATKASSLSLELLGLIKDLTFRSSTADKTVIISAQDGIFGGLIASICKAGETADQHLVDWFTAVIWNLVLDKTICDQILALDQTHDFPIVGYLLRLLDSQNAESDPGKSDQKIRRNATSCIGNMLSHTEFQTLLLVSQNASMDLGIIPVLMDLVTRDNDSIVRRRSMRTIRCLVSSEEAAVRKICVDNHNMNKFLMQALSLKITEDDENDRDMQMQVCQAICAVADQFSSSDWPLLETVLQQRIETTNDQKLTLAACSCLQECFRRSPWKRGSSCFSDLFWSRLGVAAAAGVDSHAPIALLLLDLCQSERESGDHENKLRPSSLTSPTVINILIHIISNVSEGHDGSRQNALDTVSILTSKEENRKPMAENENLLSALVNLCLLNLDESSKTIAKRIVIDLVPAL